MNGGADPPHGVSGEAEALVRFEPLHRLHEAHIALGDDFADGQAIAAIAHGDLGHEAQMGCDQPLGGVAVAMFAPALGEHIFFLRLQHGEPANFGKVARQTTFSGYERKRSGHSNLLGAPRGACAPVPVESPVPTKGSHRWTTRLRGVATSLRRCAGRANNSYRCAGPWLKEGGRSAETRPYD